MVASPRALENCQEAFRELTAAFHDTWWLLVRAEDQARGERLAPARATRLAAHKGGAADTFDASLRRQIVDGTGQVPGSAKSRFAHDSGPPKHTRAQESAPASATASVPVRDSTHPQKLKDGTYRTD